MATLQQCLISRFGDIHWLSRSSNLTPPDYFPWGYLKERVYLGKPCTALELKRSIRREIEAILADVLHCTMVGMKERAKECSLRGSDHQWDVIFKP
jgi:hypothetical protein